MKIGIILITLLILLLNAQANTQGIEEKWQGSPNYEKFLKLKELGKNNEAETIQITTVTKITNEVLKLYVKDFKDKFEDMMSVKVKALPFGLKTVLAGAYMKGKVLLSPEHMNEKDLNKFVSGLYWYIDSIYHSKGITEKKAYSLQRKFPELKGTKYMDLLIELGNNFDVINDNKKAIKEINRHIKESNRHIKEYKEDIQKWDKMIKQLKAIGPVK